MTEGDVPVTPSRGRYLCGILYEALGSSEPVQTGALATRLAVSHASVTEAVAEFDDRGLVAYEPYRGAELTARGEAAARRLFWLRCAVKRFFELMLGMPLETDRAYQIGFSLPTTIQTISEYVDQPRDERCEATSQEKYDLAVPTGPPNLNSISFAAPSLFWRLDSVDGLDIPNSVLVGNTLR
ncbi:metal-dependent transcriptional regulator [Halorubrum sp. BOL3-1]|uniref:metal-dependent transcriptional regulator n=1 Tax=Halorubrum sp. BOL3-1 TaxID=2497325 RepID=UPI00140CCC2A|nr:metal-dependent transcriptional regulator [Halorubrum sp. BOL3-1]